MVNGTIKLALEIQRSLSIYFYTTPKGVLDSKIQLYLNKLLRS
ncbi:hypothetical protein Cal6303_2513 [Calothrix sp. PCC 6303]|nr:hypothetical protein Cal6303_2513 [Calothrix sp. PCC 6303]